MDGGGADQHEEINEVEKETDVDSNKRRTWMRGRVLVIHVTEWI